METAAKKKENDDTGMLEESPKTVECSLEKTEKKKLSEKKEKVVNPAVEEFDFVELLTKDLDREVAELRDYLEGPDVEEPTGEINSMQSETNAPLTKSSRTTGKASHRVKQNPICQAVKTNVHLKDSRGQHKLAVKQLGGIERQPPPMKGLNPKKTEDQAKSNKRPRSPVKSKHPFKKQFD